MNTNMVIERTHAYIAQNFLYTRPDAVVGTNEPLLERGIIDSMGVMELVQFLEAEFGVAVGDDEITEENLGSLGAIARFVCAKLPRDAQVA